MSRLVPHPLLSLGLLLMWLMLNRFSPGHLLLGAAVALVAGQAMSALATPKPRIRSLSSVLRLFALVMADIVRSNVAVARLIVAGRRGAPRQAGFVEIDLALRDPTALALLAIVLTATPGTAWLDYHRSSGRLLLHVFDLVDDADWIDLVKRRYEPLLMEIFE
jgi:multicomponent K+:H+ antiporter subunit E